MTYAASCAPGQTAAGKHRGGLDPYARFIDLLPWTNTEFAHQAAEIACLRDLYRAEKESAS